MPKKNHTPRNAFYHFMMDFKTKHGKNMHQRELSEAAGPVWNKMSKEQRRPYEEKALMEKNNMRGGKCTSEGLDIELLLKQERTEQMKIQDMQHDIKTTWNMSRSSGHIQHEPIFIIHINTFCYCSSRNRHYPAEIGITCFNLEDGVLPQNVFHRVICPGPLPLGFAADAMLHSRETHQFRLPLSGDKDNTEDVYNEMKEFLSTKLQGSKRMPILYTEQKMMKMVQHVLDTWCYDFGEDPLFKVYELQYMFKILRNTVADEEVWHSDTFGTREIEKDVYAYSTGIACEYHDVTSVPVYCSRSVCVRYAYIICDNCCPDLQIPLIPGTHLPDQAMATTYRGSSRGSSASSVSSRSSRSSRFTETSTREDDSDSVISFSSKSEWDNQSLLSESSVATTIEDNFPSLGAKKKVPSQSTPHATSSSSQSYESSSKSYAGIIGKAGLSKRTMDIQMTENNKREAGENTLHDDFKTSSFTNAEGNLGSPKSLDSSMGRGRGRRNDDADDFPALGRGRGQALGRSKRVNKTD